MGGAKVRGTFATDEADVAVPAGKFKAVVVASKDFRIGETQMTLTYWFAEGVGLVKQHLQLDGREVVVELQKADLPK